MSLDTSNIRPSHTDASRSEMGSTQQPIVSLNEKEALLALKDVRQAMADDNPFEFSDSHDCFEYDSFEYDFTSRLALSLDRWEDFESEALSEQLRTG